MPTINALTRLPSKCRQPWITAGMVLAVLIGLSGCTDSDNDFFPDATIPMDTVSKLDGCADTDTCVSNPPLTLDEERPADVYIPSDYNTGTRYPLVILMHGYGATGLLQTLYFNLAPRVDTQQFILITPDGTLNATGARFWNATPACCAGDDPANQVDDVAYLRRLIDAAAATYSIDEDSIGLLGHSNGGFMSLRMACEASDIITSVVSLAGSTYNDAESCGGLPRLPVSVFTLHGDQDGTIPFEGRPDAFPSAHETTARYAEQAGCDTGNPLPLTALNALNSIDGEETLELVYPDCQQGAEVKLWTLRDAPHIPIGFRASTLDAIVDWLISHPRDS